MAQTITVQLDSDNASPGKCIAQAARISSASGAWMLEITDPVTLLGLYLAEIRHGHLTMLGSPPCEGGARIELRLEGIRRLSLEARIAERGEGFVTVEITDLTPFEDALRASKATWQATLAGLDSPKDAEPKLARLKEDVAIFAQATDLKHELETNLKNGGLLVESEPLPLQTKKTLRIQIGSQLIPVTIECEVVFSSAGRVGFSVPRAQETKVKLEDLLNHPETTDLLDTLPPAVASAPSVLCSSTTGSIAAPLPTHELLDYQNRKAKNVTDLQHTTTLNLVEFFSRHQARGVLAIHSDEMRYGIYFHEGNIAYIESHPFEESLALGRVLVSSKKLSESSLREALERIRPPQRSLGRVLVTMGLLSKKALLEALREQIREKMERVFSFSRGTFEWGPWREPPGDVDLVLNRGFGLIGRHVRSQFETLGIMELEPLFIHLMDRTVSPLPDLDSRSLSIGLHPKELRFIELALNGEQTIAHALTGSLLGRLGALRLIATGIAMGLLQFKDGHRAILPERSLSSRRDPYMSQLRHTLQDRLHALKGSNYFDCLGIHWSLNHRHYRAAYEKAKVDLKNAPLSQASDEVRSLAQELNDILDQAYATLSQERLRIAYRQQLFNKTDREYNAEMLVKQSEIALIQGDRTGAIETLETVVELDPSPRNCKLLASARG